MLAKQLSLRNRKDPTRYEGENLMKYAEEGGDGEPDCEKNEDAGVIHLVHGWIQLGQKDKVSRKIIIFLNIHL
jgi:hypothetical protein